MDNCSYFIKDKAIFGSFPTQESVNELEQEGVRYFIDLTDINTETRIVKYTTKYTYINYPIKDNYIPTHCVEYSKFIIRLAKIIKNLPKTSMIYIHCKGGHGRSGVVVASLLCFIFNLTPEQALEYTTKCHSNRRIMRDKWRKIGSPQTYIQKKFIHKFFEPLKIYHSNKNSISLGFSNISNHTIKIDNNEFYNTELAIKAALENSTQKLENILLNILQSKFNQNETIKNNILNTCLRPFIYITKYSEKDPNIIGKLLTKIRNEYYENI